MEIGATRGAHMFALVDYATRAFLLHVTRLCNILEFTIELPILMGKFLHDVKVIDENGETYTLYLKFHG